jgi:uncharacterized protein YcbK (DUF882 family)
MNRRAIISTVIAVFVMALIFPAKTFAIHSRSRKARVHVRHARVRHIRWNPVLRGSHESMLRQNEEIDRLGLLRIQNDEELDELIADNELVEITEGAGLRIAPNLQPNRRYCKSWTRDFVEDMGKAYYDEFGTYIQINSAVRTAEQQKKLRRRNRNAAPIEGDAASSHMAGLTIDINKRGLTRKQHKWIENYLKQFRDEGLIEVAEERRQACFHVMVSERYTDWKQEQEQPEEPAQAQGQETSVGSE